MMSIPHGPSLDLTATATRATLVRLGVAARVFPSTRFLKFSTNNTIYNNSILNQIFKQWRKVNAQSHFIKWLFKLALRSKYIDNLTLPKPVHVQDKKLGRRHHRHLKYASKLVSHNHRLFLRMMMWSWRESKRVTIKLGNQLYFKNYFKYLIIYV